MRLLVMRIVVLWGWRRYLLALLAGGASALSLPPYYFFPVLFLTFPILVWLLDGVASARGGWRNFFTAGMVGWSFGFGYFLAGLYWVRQAFLVEADIFAWMVPFVLLLFPAGLAIFPACACALARLFWAPGFRRIFVLAAVWAGFEWIKGTILTGFPWNAIGYGFSGSAAMAQSLSVVGIYGLSLLTVLIACGPAVQADERADEARPPVFWRWPGLLVSAILLIFIWGAGQYRLLTAKTEYAEDVNLRIVQANIAQKDKWNPAKRSEILAAYLELSNQATSPDRMGIKDVSLLIWPESALPFLLQNNQDARASLAALIPENTKLITGALRRGGKPEKTAPRNAPVYNSIFVVGHNGEIEAIYDKYHLVPFGEYLPFNEQLSKFGLRKLVTIPGGFTAAKARNLLRAGSAKPFIPLVCYEAIFPQYSARNKQAHWILNVTNDAWFGTSIGPWQHFEQARARAIEQGLPLVRAANTGISAVVDPYGRIVHRLGISRRGVIDARLPKRLPVTLYAQYGNGIFAAMLVFLLCLIGVLHIRAARGGQ